MSNRLRAIGLFCSLLLSLLVLRAGYIQIYAGKQLAAHASREHSRSINNLPIRGLILDRNGNALAGSWPTRWLVASRQTSPMAISAAEIKAGVKAGTYLERWVKAVDRGSGSIVLDVRAGEKPGLELLNLPGLRISEAYTRYREPALAPHLLGYTTMADSRDSVNHGATGVEQKYDNWLSAKSVNWSELVDGRGRPIPGVSNQIRGLSSQTSLVLTLDRRVQELAQQAMASSGVKRGAVVVLDITTRDILAMASFPEFNPDNLRVANANDYPYINRALLPYHPGSLFKVAVAAAVQENQLLDESALYRCPGYYSFPSGVTISCWKKEGHGILSFDQGLAQSCNSTFIQIGQLAGRDKLMDQVNRLHLLDNQITGFSDMEKRGMFRVEPGGPALANACLGQQGVMLTPLRVANMMATVADNGWWRPPRLVLEQRQGDRPINLFRQPPARQVLSSKTSQRLQKMLCSVVDEGTGKKASGIWPAAGKTASSEAPGDILHTWFAGYVPAKQPRIAIAVLVEQGNSGGTTCAPIFRMIADGAAKIYNW